MLKSKTTAEVSMKTADFVKFNESIFHDPKIPADVFTPLVDAAP
jgi:hypothetical protein